MVYHFCLCTLNTKNLTISKSSTDDSPIDAPLIEEFPRLIPAG